MTRDRTERPTGSADIAPWSSARDWAPIAALLGRDEAALRDEVAALPDPVEAEVRTGRRGVQQEDPRAVEWIASLLEPEEDLAGARRRDLHLQAQLPPCQLEISPAYAFPPRADI